MTLGEKIKTYRKQNGLTQKQLSEKLKLAPGTVQQYELNKRTPSMDKLQSIASVLGIPTAELISGGIHTGSDVINQKILEHDSFIQYLQSIGYELQSQEHDGVKFYDARNKTVLFVSDQKLEELKKDMKKMICLHMTAIIYESQK